MCFPSTLVISAVLVEKRNRYYAFVLETVWLFMIDTEPIDKHYDKSLIPTSLRIVNPGAAYPDPHISIQKASADY